MITAIDTNILLDIFGADAKFGTLSKNALQSATTLGNLIACEVVWAEVSTFFPSIDSAQEAMGYLGIEFSPLQQKTSLIAAQIWKSYRNHGGSRTRIVADFLIGAHALSQADQLLTRDRGFYRTCFSHLNIIDPIHPDK